MKKLKTSDITDSASMPLKSGSLDFIQAAYQETTTAIIVDLLGYVPNNINGYIMFGAISSNIGSTYTITDGYIYYQGEIFRVVGNTFNLGGGEQIWGIISDNPYPNADPVLFGDNIQRTVHLDRIMTFTNGIAGDLLFTSTIKSALWLTGDIKEVDCTNAYITANFDGTGLGINERKGWAICNGNNGTKNRNGRVSIAYGTSYTTMGAIGGEASHVLTIPEIPPHSHTFQRYNYEFKADFSSDELVPRGGLVTDSTSSIGGGLGHNNLQPYLVTLFIQKI